MTTETALDNFAHKLRDEELALLHSLRRRQRLEQPAEMRYTLGERVADQVAAGMGSWPFIIIQSVLLAVWIALNVTAWVFHWDPYPFILLNLALSFQAAYAAPFIMMSQNRQAAIDRRDAKNDYTVNIKAELEIELLHQKIDQMREEEIARLRSLVEDLTGKLMEITSRPVA
ncbi:MAG: DUF1003 domain-containing protein [Acidocella sp.]|uniref:DUF1003 domain-containing protein n=1 Tax=Acidocella sp. TaxID=50710 RepID=UPI003FC5D894